MQALLAKFADHKVAGLVLQLLSQVLLLSDLYRLRTSVFSPRICQCLYHLIEYLLFRCNTVLLRVQEAGVLFPVEFQYTPCCVSARLFFVQLPVCPQGGFRNSGLHLFNQFDFSSLAKHSSIV